MDHLRALFSVILRNSFEKSTYRTMPIAPPSINSFIFSIFQARLNFFPNDFREKRMRFYSSKITFWLSSARLNIVFLTPLYPRDVLSILSFFLWDSVGFFLYFNVLLFQLLSHHFQSRSIFLRKHISASLFVLA